MAILSERTGIVKEVLRQHNEVVNKSSITLGFEGSTDIVVNVDPDDLAGFSKDQQVKLVLQTIEG